MRQNRLSRLNDDIIYSYLYFKRIKYTLQEVVLLTKYCKVNKKQIDSYNHSEHLEMEKSRCETYGKNYLN
jgi:hypothetical protein